MNWIYRIFCRHNWIEVQKGRITEENNIVAVFFIQRCSKCGQMETYKGRI